MRTVGKTIAWLVFVVVCGGGLWMIVASRPAPVAAPVSEPQAADITYTNTSAEQIVVELPFPGAVTGKEFSVIGKARGYWFFEASFPVELRTLDGTILGGGVATAQGDWMTEDFVPFTAELQTPSAFIGPAVLILKRDNPSGEPKNDASISFPIVVEY
jgi:hypothetical protein